MKMAFATCVQLGFSCIEEIFNIGGDLDLMITLHDTKATKKSGRIYLDDIAKQHNVPLLKIDNINEEKVISTLKDYNIDWLFIIGWSQIAKEELLNTPNKGCIGMHPTLLPQGRGRAAIPWAIIKGLDKTGVTMFKLDEDVDTGEIIDQGVIPLDETTTASDLYQKVNEMHITLINRNWSKIVNDKLSLQKQDESEATYWPGRKPKDGQIKSDMTMKEADRLVRAVTHPYPGAFYYENGQKIIVWSAKTDKEQGSFRLKDGYLQPIEYEVLDYEG